MTQFNIFIENMFSDNKLSDINIDEVKIYNDVMKMTEYIFNIKEVKENCCLKNYEYKSVSFDIVLTDNERIHQINKEYRHVDSATDVITFAIFSDSSEEERFIIDSDIALGEIIISLNKIYEQAKEHHCEFYDELYFIISHGVLHLLGFDHQNESDYNFMIENQNKSKAIVL